MNPPERLPRPRPAPDPLSGEWAGLLSEPFDQAWCREADRPAILRERVLDRVSRSARASRSFVTVRRKDSPLELLANGVGARLLYQSAGQPSRHGEPWRVRMLRLEPGSAWQPDIATGMRAEWLVMAGDARLDGDSMEAHDYQVAAPGVARGSLSSGGGAWLYLREAPAGEGMGPGELAARTVRAREHAWSDFAPGIKRRVLWTANGEAALLYHALAGAQVPRHGHGRDEECLMLEGEIFLDDVLLRTGEYQLAPAGTVHGGVSTDTGVLLFAHGDLELDIRAD